MPALWFTVLVICGSRVPAHRLTAALAVCWQKAAMKPGGTVVVVDFHRDEAKITSKAKGWVTAHVRADQAIFKAEIEAAGFTYVADADVPELHENYGTVYCCS